MNRYRCLSGLQNFHKCQYGSAGLMLTKARDNYLPEPYYLPWWRGTVVERRSLAGELSLSCARPAADG